MAKGRSCLIGCLVAAAVSLVLGVAVVAGFVYLAEDPPGMAVEVDAPPQAQLGEEFDLIVRVRNERTGKPLQVRDVDIASGYLDGFVVVQTAPKPRKSNRTPFVDSLSHTFDLTIPPGQEQRFVFRLRAEKDGIYRGDVDVYEGLRLTTVLAQTSVRPSAAPLPAERPDAISRD